MGAQWKHAGRVENSSKRGALIGKLVKEIIVSAKIGDPNPANNSRLRAAVEAAKKASVPRDTIERGIKRGAGLLGDNIVYEMVTYEGFAPHRVPIIVECLTDNKNRTAADIRVLFRKGQLGSAGAVSWMFDRLGVIEATHAEKRIPKRQPSKPELRMWNPSRLLKFRPDTWVHASSAIPLIWTLSTKHSPKQVGLFHFQN
jgi:YebC/PmpR family DNA-binding regulatory protein